MRYERTVRAEFVSRPNRFVANVILDGEPIAVHVKNTGRCREILVPGAPVVLYDSGNPERKYRYDLIAAEKDGLLINIDSQAPNRAFHEHILEGQVFGPDPKVFPEHTHGDSRFDFYVESGDRRIFAEVKGVTLEFDGVCMFPDAPTERGLKHVRGLMECVREGYEAYAVFVVQMARMREFVPNAATDPDFAEGLRIAEENGVKVLCLGCDVTDDTMRISYGMPHRMARVTRTRRSPSSCSRWCPGPEGA
ncbi:MAG: DNA/RNA nuclease SfsA [Thermoplasmata archaeon]|nr:DNA/RNA nuclease SfsA [Thermoplasmata archaeon]